MAGNIIHAIATTNAIVGGIIVSEALKVLAGGPRGSYEQLTIHTASISMSAEQRHHHLTHMLLLWMTGQDQLTLASFSQVLQRATCFRYLVCFATVALQARSRRAATATSAPAPAWWAHARLGAWRHSSQARPLQHPSLAAWCVARRSCS
jgi:hypothetical protein